VADQSPDYRPDQIAQTLERGLQILDTLHKVPDGLTVTELSARQGLPRTIATRLVNTLAKHGFVTRSSDGRYKLGLALLSMARSVADHASLATTPLMMEAAAELNGTIIYAVADGEEIVFISSIEPPSGTFRVGMRPGSRLPINLAAQGWAILAGRPALAGERPEITQARAEGYAISVGEVQPGFAGVAAPITIAGRTDVSVGCVFARERGDEADKLGAAVIDLARRMALFPG
jgi:DNA-binding IclR family transcriptional regulator